MGHGQAGCVFLEFAAHLIKCASKSHLMVTSVQSSQFGGFVDFIDDPIACMKDLLRKSGDRALLEEDGQRIHFVFSSALNREVLSDSERFHSRFFALRGPRISSQRRITSGLLSQNGELYRTSRRRLAEVFSKRSIPGYHEEAGAILMSYLQQLSVGKSINIVTEMESLMLTMTSRLLFGINDPQLIPLLGKVMGEWTRLNHEAGMGALVSNSRFLDSYPQLLEKAQSVEELIRQLFAEHGCSGQEFRTILDVLADWNSESNAADLLDDEQIGHATLVFAAAHMTTANTLAWTLFLLAQHPHLLTKLNREIGENVAGAVPTPEEIGRLTLLDAVVRESMRVLPASSYSQRIATGSSELGGLKVRSGETVIFSQFITHHRADLYENPDAFLPSRWAEVSPSPFEYLPYGTGPRACIGAGLADLEMRMILAAFLRRFAPQLQADQVVNGRVVATMLGPEGAIFVDLLPAGATVQQVPIKGNLLELVDLAAAPA